MIYFSDEGINSQLTCSEGGPSLLDYNGTIEECFSLFIDPTSHTTEIVLTKSELIQMLEEIENKL